MANDNVQDQLTDALYFVAGAIAVVSALGAMASLWQNATESVNAATRQSANTATLDLATTASSAMLILGGQPSKAAPTRTAKSVERKLRALKLRVDQGAGAPVVT
jgi:hypothetical protein